MCLSISWCHVMLVAMHIFIAKPSCWTKAEFTSSTVERDGPSTRGMGYHASSLDNLWPDLAYWAAIFITGFVYSSESEASQERLRSSQGWAEIISSQKPVHLSRSDDDICHSADRSDAALVQINHCKLLLDACSSLQLAKCVYISLGAEGYA